MLDETPRRSFVHRPNPTAVEPALKIEQRVIYEDPKGSSSYRWFIGTFIYNPGSTELVPAIVSLGNGEIYRYASGLLPDRMRRAAPGTLTISVP